MDLKMYILVNEDIKIDKGKLAGQVGHAVAVYFWRELWFTNAYHFIRTEVEDYMTFMQKKIILYASQEQLEQLEQLGCIAIRDAGLTDLEPNTLTCVNMGIVDFDNFPQHLQWIKDLKLCR